MPKGYSKMTEWRIEQAAINKARKAGLPHLADRLTVIDAYGGVCACCGEYRYEFLALDHVNNDGAAHRKEVGDVYKWAIKTKFPPSLQLLCHNCNMAKAIYGHCPHLDEGEN